MLEHDPIVDLNLSEQDVKRYIISHGWKQVNDMFWVGDGVASWHSKKL